MLVIINVIILVDNISVNIIVGVTIIIVVTISVTIMIVVTISVTIIVVTRGNDGKSRPLARLL